MRLPHRHRRTAVGCNLTPMIDVVFQLIIFFLVSSHLAKQELQMPLPLPRADSGTKADDDAATPRVTINVTADGQMLLAGHRLELSDLQQRLRAKAIESGRDLEIRIRSDRTVEYRRIEPILLACARAGVWNVTFAVYRQQDAP
jgi:biopolymer transport protein ExbD